MPQKLKPSYKFNETQLDQLKQIVPKTLKDSMLYFNSPEVKNGSIPR